MLSEKEVAVKWKELGQQRREGNEGSMPLHNKDTYLIQDIEFYSNPTPKFCTGMDIIQLYSARR